MSKDAKKIQFAYDTKGEVEVEVNGELIVVTDLPNNFMISGIVDGEDAQGNIVTVDFTSEDTKVL